jgi:DNA-binding NtrC family response regulator
MNTASPAHHASPRAWRVLLVDPDQWQRSGSRASLARQGCEVVEVRGVGAAQRALERGVFDAVMTQLCLGDGDGFQVFQAVRRVGSQAPVMVVTGISSATGAPAARTLWFTSTSPADGLFDAIHTACQETARRTERRESCKTIPMFRAVEAAASL